MLQIEDHPLVSFLPLDLTSTDSLETVVSHIDYTMQYGEDEEPKEVRPHKLHLVFIKPDKPCTISPKIWTKGISRTWSRNMGTCTGAPHDAGWVSKLYHYLRAVCVVDLYNDSSTPQLGFELLFLKCT